MSARGHLTGHLTGSRWSALCVEPRYQSSTMSFDWAFDWVKSGRGHLTGHLTGSSGRGHLTGCGPRKIDSQEPQPRGHKWRNGILQVNKEYRVKSSE